MAKGLEGVVATGTALSDVRGLEGKLIYRGYDIDELAGRVSFEEASYLLWEGNLPNQKQLSELKASLAEQRELPREVVDYILGAPKDASPMDILRTCISMLGLYDYGAIGAEQVRLNRERQISLTAKIGVVAAYFHRGEAGPIPAPGAQGSGGGGTFSISSERPRGRSRSRSHSRYGIRFACGSWDECLHLCGAGVCVDIDRYLFGPQHGYRHPEGTLARWSQ